jgi:hypothetical protein
MASYTAPHRAGATLEPRLPERRSPRPQGLFIRTPKSEKFARPALEHDSVVAFSPRDRGSDHSERGAGTFGVAKNAFRIELYAAGGGAARTWHHPCIVLEQSVVEAS